MSSLILFPFIFLPFNFTTTITPGVVFLSRFLLLLAFYSKRHHRRIVVVVVGCRFLPNSIALLCFALLHCSMHTHTLCYKFYMHFLSCLFVLFFLFLWETVRTRHTHTHTNAECYIASSVPNARIQSLKTRNVIDERNIKIETRNNFFFSFLFFFLILYFDLMF